MSSRTAAARLLPLALLASFALFGPLLGSTPARQHAPSAPPARPTATAEDARERCGSACHRFPPPEILPRAAWREELVRMMLIQEGIPEPAGASSFVPLPPDWMPLLRYYEANAPERLSPPEEWPPVDSPRVAFSRRGLPKPAGMESVAVANVRSLDLDGDGRLDVAASDMHTGGVVAALAAKGLTVERIAELGHPAHLEMVDLDRDGMQDLIVADLGSFQPADHDQGAVYWLRRSREGAYRTVSLASGLPRVADARPADFDGDGDLDIIVAAFGWRRTGSIVLLENRTGDWEAPSFVPRVIDPRHGAIHVPVTDVNADGRPDFVVLLAQEHEAVIAFVNTGRNLEFTPRVIYEAPHPNWGSSGIELVDFDRDGDEDVLLTHGDTFDDFVVKPYHGIQLLENGGTYPYAARTVARMPGAHRAQAADLDGDGDLDIVAAAMVMGGEASAGLASLVWLEQVKPGVFDRHTLEAGTPSHATLDVGDYNGDGRADIAVGWFAVTSPPPSLVDLWLSTR